MGLRWAGAKVLINFSNDALLEDTSGGRLRVYLAQHWDDVVVVPAELKCLGAMACLTDADHASGAALTPGSRGKAIAVCGVTLTDRRAEFVDEDGALVQVTLRFGMRWGVRLRSQRNLWLREACNGKIGASTLQARWQKTERSMNDEAKVLSAGEERLALERKHPLAIRWMHWINFPVLFTMMWSGLYIYWNDSIPPGVHAHEVYRVGVGHWTLFRFFPPWFYTNQFWDIRYKVTKALGYHFFFMWLFAVNGILYVAYLLWSKEWRFMVPHKESIQEAIQVTLVDLHLRKGLPAQTKYNGAQRIAYTGVIVMGLGSLLSRDCDLSADAVALAYDVAGRV